MKKNIAYKPFISIAIMLLTVMLAIVFLVAESDPAIDLIKSDYESLNTGWYVMEDGNQKYIDTLPTNVDTDNGTTVIYQVLDEKFQANQTLLLRASLQDITVYLDGEIIYQHLKSDYDDHVPYASLWHVVDLEGDNEGSILSVEIYSPYTRFEGFINDVIIGDSSSVLFYVSNLFLYRLILGIIILIAGFIILIINQFIDEEFSKGRIYLSSFVIMFSLWIIGESRMLQFLFANQTLIGSISYIMVIAMPIPIALYVRDYVSDRFKKLYQIFLYVLIVQFIAVVILQYFNILDYFESSLIVQFVLIVLAITTVVLTFIEYYNYHSKKARVFLNHFLVLVLFAVMETTNYIMNDFTNTSVYGLIIITAYLMYMLIFYIIQIRNRFKLSYQLEVLNELVYVDALTGGKNRHAFEKDMEKLFNNVQIREDLRIVMFDLDDLKEINDTQGHHSGDEALKTTLKVIENIFGEYGSCYRIGGDEFACIMTVSDKEIYDQCVKDLELTLKNISKVSTYQLNTSIGSQAYNKDLFQKPSDMLRVADQKMYLDKNRKKEERRKNGKPS